MRHRPNDWLRLLHDRNGAGRRSAGSFQGQLATRATSYNLVTTVGQQRGSGLGYLFTRVLPLGVRNHTLGNS